MLRNYFLEALARECGHDTSINNDEFVMFEDTFYNWHDHVLVTEYRMNTSAEKSYCLVKPICVFDNLNLFARCVREWIYKNVTTTFGTKENINNNILENVIVEYYGNGELKIKLFSTSEQIDSLNLTVRFIDYNQVNPKHVDGDKWFITSNKN